METITCNLEINGGWRVAAIDVSASPLSLVELRQGSSPARVFARIDLDKGAVLDRAHLGTHSIDEAALLTKVLTSAREMRLKFYPQGHRAQTTPPPASETADVAEARPPKKGHRRVGR